MFNFNNPGTLLWFPLMKKPSEESYRFDSRQRTFRLEYGPHVRFLPVALTAELADVSVKTVYKWINGTHPIDPRTRQVLYTRALGLLPCPRWSDWHIDENGRLTAPNGWSFYPDELMGLSYLKQHNGDLQADVARLTVENQQLREALKYWQDQRWPANVIPLPLAHRNARKEPG